MDSGSRNPQPSGLRFRALLIEVGAEQLELTIALKKGGAARAVVLEDASLRHTTDEESINPRAAASP
jgi:hypothetical protein